MVRQRGGGRWEVSPRKILSNLLGAERSHISSGKQEVSLNASSFVVLKVEKLQLNVNANCFTRQQKIK